MTQKNTSLTQIPKVTKGVDDEQRELIHKRHMSVYTIKIFSAPEIQLVI